LQYCSLAYSALACFRMGMSGSASFQRVRKTIFGYFLFADHSSRIVSADDRCNSCCHFKGGPLNPSKCQIRPLQLNALSELRE
jgi:hypothetical protein